MSADAEAGPRWAGPGRRSPADPVPGRREPPRRPRYRGALSFVVVICALTWAVFAVLEVAHYRETADMASLNDIVDTSTALLAFVVGGLAVMQWTVRRDRDDLFLALGFGALGTMVIDPIAPVGFVVALALLAVPVLLDRVRPYPAVAAAGAAAVAVALAAALLASSTFVEIVAGRRDRGALTGVESAGHALAAAVLLALAWPYFRRGRHRQRTFHTWVGLALFALAQSRLALALTIEASTLWLAGSRLLRLEALFFALMGMNRELQEGFTRQQSELRTSQARVRSMETQREAEQAALEERRHDVRSALFAIGGVAELLRRSHEELDAGTLEALTQALGAEVQRLQGLVAEQEREDCLPFSVLKAVSPLLLVERSNGLDVTCAIDERLVAVGRPKETVQVLRNLLDNARLYAPGSPVAVRAEERDEWVVLLVEDRGPGIRSNERKAVFERGRRGPAAEGTQGSGLGLYVAARLMREQGGDLWVTDRSGGGASFVLSLPAPR